MDARRLNWEMLVAALLLSLAIAYHAGTQRYAISQDGEQVLDRLTGAQCTFYADAWVTVCAGKAIRMPGNDSSKAVREWLRK